MPSGEKKKGLAFLSRKERGMGVSVLREEVSTLERPFRQTRKKVPAPLWKGGAQFWRKRQIRILSGKRIRRHWQEKEKSPARSGWRPDEGRRKEMSGKERILHHSPEQEKFNLGKRTSERATLGEKACSCSFPRGDDASVRTKKNCFKKKKSDGTNILVRGEEKVLHFQKGSPLRRPVGRENNQRGGRRKGKGRRGGAKTVPV